mgnify:CR=1 FL=1|tara:strand:+ start:1164 stop:1895 length:732 start_codon:yes stop_codon:yes gene_type:complete
MGYLNYIDDKILFAIIRNALTKTIERQTNIKKDFHKNVIDPFGATFSASLFEGFYSHDEWIVAEEYRQIEKTLTNQIGVMHQEILGNVIGWKSLDKKKGHQVDLVCEDRKIIAEVKNKYSTVSGGKLKDGYDTLNKLVTPKTSVYSGFTSYWVNIIPKTPTKYDHIWTPSNSETGAKCPEHERIRTIDGRSFYELVTGESDALEDLFKFLPKIIMKILNEEYNRPKIDNIDWRFEYFDRAYNN